MALWDVRQNKQQVHFFKAHDHPIKCIAIDPSEDLVVTGAVDGDIKVRSTTAPPPLPLIMFVTLYGKSASSMIYSFKTILSRL